MVGLPRPCAIRAKEDGLYDKSCWVETQAAGTGPARTGTSVTGFSCQHLEYGVVFGIFGTAGEEDKALHHK
jgi:hypothetical protein